MSHTASYAQSPTFVGAGSFRYEVDLVWANLPSKYGMGEVVGTANDAHDRVYVFHRGPRPVMVFDRDGNFSHAWGDELFSRAHGIFIGPDNSVYCTDDMGHSVRKCTSDGRLLLTLGTPGVACETGAVDFDYRNIQNVGLPFNLPTNVALAPNGEIYASDGYGNARIHRFSPAGQLLASWGRPGAGPGEFHVPHGVAVDRAGLVYVCDRENSRVQMFSPTGEYGDQWRDLARPCQLCFDAEGNIYVAELGYRAGMFSGNLPPHENATGGRLSIFDRNRKLLAQWGGGDNPTAPGDFIAPHGISVDSRGDIYLSEVVLSAAANRGLVSPTCHTLQKFVRRPQ